MSSLSLQWVVYYKNIVNHMKYEKAPVEVCVATIKPRT